MSRAWVFGDNIDTDQLAPGLHMKGSLAELSRHCLELVDPAFASSVRPGDVVVGGRNFGMGSSREQAVQALRHLGVGAVVARSFAGIFFRNAYNLGLLALVSDQVGRIRPGDDLALDGRGGRIDNRTTGESIACELVPDHLMALVQAGGLVPMLERRFKPAKGG
ncbi:MAG: 3-isopropylmalate dehydratase [Alphaproteobacteria bacterium]|nr:3-isopropylmalate dehydratase [Alphaproteobacteria bacterium]